MIMIRHFLAATALGSAMILAGCNSGADSDAPALLPKRSRPRRAQASCR